ncbi:MAG TPA: cysteine peptidase family C39 domain-containing protein [Phycisphaerales bacterium]|nr:cysteine peptidase family C39 domain-containing protein [Phycisphaerales bacterium]
MIAAFVIQVVLALAAALAAPWVGRRGRGVWLTVLIAATVVMACWPLIRVFTPDAVALLGVRTVVCTELTAMIVPATLFFGIVAGKVPNKRDGRMLLVLSAAVGLYFVKAGAWMVWPAGGGVGEEARGGVGGTKIDGAGVCRQSTGYTCVAASMVTLLQARGVPADEAEMARLSYTEIGGGATDSRALLALRTKLDAHQSATGERLHAAYGRMDAAGLIAAAKPCLVQMDWGFFVSHMVPVMDADSERVIIGDPLEGTRSVPMAEFVREWKGRAITVE